MHPIRINLLSPEKRKYLRHIIYIQFAKNTLASVVFVFCLSGITLLGCQWVLQEYFNDVSANILATNSRYAEKNQKIKEVNNLIAQTDAIQQTYTVWSPIITNLTNSVPEGILIENLSLNSNNHTFAINGKAQTRENLLQTQTNLNNLDFIENVNIPLSQLTEKININFSISAIYK